MRITHLEILKATQGMETRKVPEPDGYPIEIYRNILALVAVLGRLAYLVVITGTFQKQLCTIYLAALVKPGKYPHQAGSHRPIALFRAPVEIAEAVIYHRILPVVESQLEPAQPAYRRNRRTDMCLVEIMGNLRRPLFRGRFWYLASFDVAGASDNVSQRQWVKGLERMCVDPHAGRLIHNCLSARTFQVKMTLLAGARFCSTYPIPNGLLQGGALSLLLWFFFQPGLRGAMWKSEKGAFRGRRMWRLHLCG